MRFIAHVLLSHAIFRTIIPPMNTLTHRGWQRCKSFHETCTHADLKAWALRAGVPYGTVRALPILEKGPRADTLSALEAAIPEDFSEAANG